MASFKRCKLVARERFKRKFKPKFSERVPNGSHFYGLVSHVEDPFNFYVTIETRETEQLAYLLDELQKECTLAERIYHPFPGLACAAELDGQWRRALLEESDPSSDDWEIFFIDSGYRKVVKILHLKKLHNRFMTLPAQAVLCHLGMTAIPNVSSVKNQNAPWSAESCRFFKELVEKCFVNIFTVGDIPGGVGRMPTYYNESTLYVTMHVGDDKTTVNTIFAQSGYGLSTNLQEHAEKKRTSQSFLASRPSSLEMVESSKARLATNLYKLERGSCVKRKTTQMTDKWVITPTGGMINSFDREKSKTKEKERLLKPVRAIVEEINKQLEEDFTEVEKAVDDLLANRLLDKYLRDKENTEELLQRYARHAASISDSIKESVSAFWNQEVPNNFMEI